jgi:hypothetical protein
LLDDGIGGGQSKKTTPTVLDVAGGAGTLSWILTNVDKLNSIIVDPKLPNHHRLVKSVEFLLDHPEECAVRAIEDVPTHQPLAKLIPSLVRNCGSSIDGNSSDERNKIKFQPTSPSYMRIRVNLTLVNILRKVIINDPTSSMTTEDGGDNDTDNLLLWDEYWKKSSIVMESNNNWNMINTTVSVSDTDTDTDNCQILDSRHALEVFQSLDLLVGFHP